MNSDPTTITPDPLAARPATPRGPSGDPATLRTVATFARRRADDLLRQARETVALSNKRRLLASGAIGELRHLADVLDGMAVKAEEGGAS